MLYLAFLASDRKCSQTKATRRQARKSVTAKANTSGLAVRGKGDQRPYFLNGCQWRRGFTTLNKQLFRGNSSFNESTAYLLIYNMFYTKQSFWTELFLEFTPKKMLFYKRSHGLLATGGIQLAALLIHSYGIRKRPMIVAQL